MPIDLAALSTQVFITHGLDNNMPQYEATTGEVQHQLQRDSQPDGIAAFKPNSIIITNGKHNYVHKFNIRKGGQRRWTFTDVIEPYSVIVDDRGVIWVRSNRYDRFALISRDGKVCERIYQDDAILYNGQHILQINQTATYVRTPTKSRM